MNTRFIELSGTTVILSYFYKKKKKKTVKFASYRHISYSKYFF